MTKKEVTQLGYEITGLAIEVHKNLGPALLESVYEKCLKHELISNGYEVQDQIKVDINYKGVFLDAGLRIDLLVENTIIVELKAVEYVLLVHEAQLMTYMKLFKLPQGLLINFHTDNITRSLKPLVNNYFKRLLDS